MTPARWAEGTGSLGGEDQRERLDDLFRHLEGFRLLCVTRGAIRPQDMRWVLVEATDRIALQ